MVSEKKVCVGVYTPTHTFFSGHFHSGLSSYGKIMPIIINPNEMIVQKGNGWVEIILADENAIGVPAIAAHRWSFEPNAHGPQQTHSGVDQLLYVIAGSGVVIVGEVRLPLEKESVLWLEPDDSYRFEAGPDGMEILQGYPPESRVWNP